MTKILKAVMFTRLYDKFPHVKSISRDRVTKHLVIHSESPSYLHKHSIDPKIKDGEEEICTLLVFKIACANPKDSAEPYTKQTLEKALREYPILFRKEIEKIQKDPDFISFVTYTTPLSKEELEKDMERVFNATPCDLDNDSIRHSFIISLNKPNEKELSIPGKSAKYRK